MCLITLAGWFNKSLLKKNRNPRCNFLIFLPPWGHGSPLLSGLGLLESPGLLCDLLMEFISSMLPFHSGEIKFRLKNEFLISRLKADSSLLIYMDVLLSKDQVDALHEPRELPSVHHVVKCYCSSCLPKVVATPLLSRFTMGLDVSFDGTGLDISNSGIFLELAQLSPRLTFP
jgi:hypothetical protein